MLDWCFNKETNVKRPTDTPLFGDSVWVDGWPWETDAPSRDLYTGAAGGAGMSRIAVARHGAKSASAAPRDVGTGPVKLPGGVDVAFFDGHAGTVALENLWS